RTITWFSASLSGPTNDVGGRHVLDLGKGGVGKSAVAAAYALAARRRGERVLAIDMLDGGGLGAHLGEPDLTFEPRPIGEGLHASTIDRAEALLEYLRVQVGIPALATIGPAARAFDALASTAPAIREVVTIGKVLWEVKRGVWDLVVADAAPTGQIGSYLRAARTGAGDAPGGAAGGGGGRDDGVGRLGGGGGGRNRHRQPRPAAARRRGPRKRRPGGGGGGVASVSVGGTASLVVAAAGRLHPP